MKISSAPPLDTGVRGLASGPGKPERQGFTGNLEWKLDQITPTWQIHED